MHLVYFADPMCSWCYGFGPELRGTLEGRPDARLELVMGGLRPYNREPMSAAFRAMLMEHWQHVGEASGLPFTPAALDREGFTYDTEPACRAVVTARLADVAQAFDYLEDVQAAFYRDGRDTTDEAVLTEIAGETGYGREAFAARLASEELRERVRLDFARSQQLGVAGFPTLALQHDERLYLVTSGFVRAGVLDERLDEIARRLGAAGAPA